MGEVKFNKKVPNLPKSRVLKWGCIYQNVKKRNVKLVYNNKWTADSLTTIKERIKREYNFDVQFNDVSYDENDFAKSFNLSVICNDGYRGSAYFAGQPNIKFGFYRNYGMFTKSFGIGYIGD